MKTRIKWLHNLQAASPSIWEGLTEDNKNILIVYRDGELTVYVNKIADFTRKLGGVKDAVLADNELTDAIYNFYELPLEITT